MLYTCILKSRVVCLLTAAIFSSIFLFVISPLAEGSLHPFPVVSGGMGTWADANSNWSYDAGEQLSPVVLTAADYGQGKGRVVGFSNGDTFSNYCYKEYDNQPLGLNIVNWLAEANGNNNRVLFDHHTYDYYFEVKQKNNGKFKGDFSKLPTALTDSGYQVDVLEYRDYGHDPISITYSSLQGYDVFVMPTPMTTFSGDELSAIQQFVNEGGSVFLFTTLCEIDGNGQYLPPDAGDNLQVMNSCNQVADLFGFNWNMDAVHDPDHYSPGDALSAYPDTNQPIFSSEWSNFSDHPITDDITSFGTYELVPSISIAMVPEPATILLLLSAGLLTPVLKKKFRA